MTAARLSRRPSALLALALAGICALSPLAAGPSAAAGPRAAAGSVAPSLSVVVTSMAGGVDAAAAAVLAAGGTVLERFPLIGGVAAEVPAGTVLAPSMLVAPNRPLQVAGQSAADGPASTVRATVGLGAPAGEGAGVTIAVVDTGVAASPDLENRLTQLDMTGIGKGDGYGHGTFVAGIAAASGASSDGRYAGIAPGAHVLDVRVAGDDGSTDLQTVLAGLQAVANHGGVDVLNLSLSSGSPLPHQIDPLTVALSRLWAQGVVVVVAAGNDGPNKASVSSPGSDPTLLTVGSLDEVGTAGRSDDTVPDFSARGPAPQGADKPDLVAPGRSLVSLRAPGSVVDLANTSSSVGEAYFVGSGTSFSTAVVAGAAAALLAQRPTLTPDEVKTLVMQTAYTAKGLKDRRAAGAGGLDVAAALAATPQAVSVKDRGKARAGAELPPGDVDQWNALLDALLTGDRAQAANSWSLLSPEAHRWAAHRWAGLSPVAHRWAANSWSAHRWAGADGSADEWRMRFWAADQWAAHRWADDSWAASRWAAHRWAASRWADENWAASRWAASRWAASRWAGTWQ